MKQLSNGMGMRFFGGGALGNQLVHQFIVFSYRSGPFGDFGYGGGPGFPRHPADFFPPGAMGFLGPHPGCRSHPGHHGHPGHPGHPRQHELP